MKIRLFFALCGVLFWSKEVHAQVDYEVKRGAHPFMAILYYTDETVLDSAGNRFQRSAMLIRPQWLVSSSIDSPVVDGVQQGFPRKTLLAKAGAITVDTNFTLNEDEDEQEREIIQIVRSTSHKPETYWNTNINLLQTLLPFKITSAVDVITIKPKEDLSDRNCFILVFAKKYSNSSEDKALIRINVEVLPGSTDNCGPQFVDGLMSCSIDTKDTKNDIFNPDYCQSNSGGPLVCDNQVVALQTYIDNKCAPPHLYQLLSPWMKFITCGVTEKCNEASCNICHPIYKDQPQMRAHGSAISSQSTEASAAGTDVTSEASMSVTKVNESPAEVSDAATSLNQELEPTQTDASVNESSSTQTQAENIEPGAAIKSGTKMPPSSISTTSEEMKTRSWPIERVQVVGKIEPPEVRHTKLEAQRQNPMKPKLQPTKSGESRIYILPNVISLFVLACLI